MPYVSINRVAVKPGTEAAVERAIAPFMQAQQELIRQGDLLATRLLRGEGGEEYALVSVWANREAHERHEDSLAERATLAQLAPFMSGLPFEFAGEVIAELP